MSTLGDFLGSRLDFLWTNFVDLIYDDYGDVLPTKKNELSHKFLKFLTKETKQIHKRISGRV